MSELSDALNEANVDQLSVREIARRGGDRVHHSALGKYMKPIHGRPSEEVLEVFSDVLRIPMPRLRELAAVPAGEGEPYEPPREANRLDRRQRRLVDELIRMLAEGKAGDLDQDDGQVGLIYAATGTGKSQAVLDAASKWFAKYPDGRVVVISGGVPKAYTRDQMLSVLPHAFDISHSLADLSGEREDVDGEVSWDEFNDQVEEYRQSMLNELATAARRTGRAPSGAQSDEERAAELGLEVVRAAQERARRGQGGAEDESSDEGVTGS